MSANI